MTLPPRIGTGARRGGSVTFEGGDTPQTVSWAELGDDACSMAAGLSSRGIGPGDQVAVLGPTSRALVTAIEATWLAGAAVVVLPLPMRMGSLEEFIATTRQRVADAAATVVLIDAQFAEAVEPGPDDPPLIGLDEVADGHRAEDFSPVEVTPRDLAVVQFTSGSTSDPKGVMLPHEVMCSNLDAIAEAGALDPDHDVLMSWLPLYHDMGLVGILATSMTSGCDLVLAGPQAFMASPRRWVEWLSSYRATVTAGPNFAWAMATRALRRLDGLDLSRLRMALNGAEPVDPDAMEALVEAGARHGLEQGAVFPAFGMAETGIAGAFPPPMRGLVTDTVDGRVLEREGYAAPIADAGADGARRLVRLGAPVPGLEMRVVDPATGARRQDRETGELEIRGTSVTPGYFRRPDATTAAFRDGWLRTGDLAYLVDGELVLCGRLKDLIIVGGRNICPQDIERGVGEVDGVRTRNVIAFGVEGRAAGRADGRRASRRAGETIVVVAESRCDDIGPVRDAVAARVRALVGVSAGDVVVTAPGSLPKTSSGKVQRSLCRQQYLDAALQPA